MPEYYGLRPGAERPAIVYLWKEYDGSTWSKSTWSSTVQHPTQQAIDDINNLTSFTKQTGTNVRAIKLTDGSLIKATGLTPEIAETNFNFLLGQVLPQFIPADEAIRTTTTVQLGIDERTLTLRQIEYYPDGAGANKNPTIRRVLNPP